MLLLPGRATLQRNESSCGSRLLLQFLQDQAIDNELLLFGPGQIHVTELLNVGQFDRREF